MEPVGEAARVRARASSSSSTSARPRSAEQLHPFERLDAAAGVLDPRRRDREPVPSRSRSPRRPDERELRITVKAVGDYTRALRGARARARRRSSRARTARSRSRDVAEPPADLARGRHRRDAVPEHGAEPRRRRRAGGRLLLLRRARGGGALPRRAPRDRSASATTSASSSSRATADGFLTAERLAERARRPRARADVLDLRPARDDRQPARAAREARRAGARRSTRRSSAFAKLGRRHGDAAPRRTTRCSRCSGRSCSPGSPSPPPIVRSWRCAG